jgi:hypothetical protein
MSNTHSTTDGQQFDNYHGNTPFRDCAVVTTTYDPPKPLRDFVQLDGWADGTHKMCDSIMRCDDDGDILMGGTTREPQQSGTTVRVYIEAGARLDDVLRIIRKQLEWLERDGLSIGMAEEPAW